MSQLNSDAKLDVDINIINKTRDEIDNIILEKSAENMQKIFNSITDTLKVCVCDNLMILLNYSNDKDPTIIAYANCQLFGGIRSNNIKDPNEKIIFTWGYTYSKLNCTRTNNEKSALVSIIDSHLITAKCKFEYFECFSCNQNILNKITESAITLQKYEAIQDMTSSDPNLLYRYGLYNIKFPPFSPDISIDVKELYNEFLETFSSKY